MSCAGLHRYLAVHVDNRYRRIARTTELLFLVYEMLVHLTFIRKIRKRIEEVLRNA